MMSKDVIEILKKLSGSLNGDKDEVKAKTKEIIETINNYSRSDLNTICLGQTLDIDGAEPYILNILQALGIPSIYHGRFKNPQIKLYDFLKEIRELCPIPEKKEILDDYVGAIFKKIKFNWAQLGLIIFLGILGIETSFLGVLWAGKFSDVVQVFSSAILFPIISIVGGAGYLCYYLYKKYIAHDIPPTQKLRDIVARIMHSSLYILGYVFSITAVITSSPILATFFIVARSIEFINSCINYIYLKKPENLYIPAITLEQHQQNTRLTTNYIQKRNNYLLDILGSLLILGVVAASFFVPIAFPLAMGLAFGIVTILHFGIIGAQVYNGNKIDEYRTESFEDIERFYEHNEQPKLSHTTIHSLLGENGEKENLEKDNNISETYFFDKTKTIKKEEVVAEDEYPQEIPSP